MPVISQMELGPLLLEPFCTNLFVGDCFVMTDDFRVARDTGAVRKLQGTTFRVLYLVVSER
jgi:hypothetical protein